MAASVERSISRREPFLWINEHWQSVEKRGLNLGLGLTDVHEAERRLAHFAVLLSRLFPELDASNGIIESELYPAPRLQRALMKDESRSGRWFIKGDHALPVAGSIKARGGIYEVLLHAENLLLSAGLIKSGDDATVLASPKAQQFFARHAVAVGSTGNLGLSIGIVAAALGFQTTVHMSSDAKTWKKARLRERGVQIVDHDGDFSAAVAAGREEALARPNTYFVDDENSMHLFLGYAVAALRLSRQLLAFDIKIDRQHPLFVYLPCGVGGAPGGITFGLRHLLGDQVHCFFAEPLSSPSMLVRLASNDDRPISVRAFGLDNCTAADGLAVAQASELAARLVRPLISGVFTVPDDDLFADLYCLERSEGLRIEPSAAAGFRGPRWIIESMRGRQYLNDRGLADTLDEATHVLWTTGGAFVPDEEYQQFHARGRAACATTR